MHNIGGVIMTKGTVGASIVGIITESLYDKPIVVFREYIQNAADSLDVANSIEKGNDYSANIWETNDDLYFLDNGTGIVADEFLKKMIGIANSGKSKMANIGYKGIGRLSGLPYCKKLSFINIIDFREGVFQEYVIDSEKYADIRKQENYNELEFSDLMTKIGSLTVRPNIKVISGFINENQKMFVNRNTGFLVILNSISPVLKNVIEDEHLLDNLGWLLPVPFKHELFNSTENPSNCELFFELSNERESEWGSTIPAKGFNVYFNKEHIYRPLTTNMLRTYLCKSDMEQYAVCVHTFSNKKIELDRTNQFSGIRVYIDNVLLCDENELIPALRQYGLIQHGNYEVLQSVRGIGAMIFIVDKINISANARRTFIDVTDNDSFNFLTLLGAFVDSIFTARYALSGYDAAKRKEGINEDKIKALREKAIRSLEALARSKITFEEESVPEPPDFQSLSKTEQKRIIKSIISRELASRIKDYLAQTEEFNSETCFTDFKTWLTAN
jgi:molecular chaperone HtpG